MSSVKGRYARIEIPLNIAETGKELHITGDYLGVISITGDGSCDIKLDHRHSQAIDLREITGFSGFFERLYLTTDGEGGICSIYVGTGMAVHIAPDITNLWAGSSASTQITTLNDVVEAFASESFQLHDVSIVNTNSLYACYVGSYNSIPATFRTYAYTLLPHKILQFGIMDMYALGLISYDGVHNVKVDVLGTYQ